MVHSKYRLYGRLGLTTVQNKQISSVSPHRFPTPLGDMRSPTITLCTSVQEDAMYVCRNNSSWFMCI